MSAADTGIRDLPADGAGRLLARVGERVRQAREQKGIPRRILSERSGVSPRYLAQLEAGVGNISIALLHRVAVALDQRIEWLVGDDDPLQAEAMRVAELFAQADPDARQAALAALSAAPTGGRGRRVCLVGLRGAGKSTLGAMAGTALGVPFIELNEEIERQSGMPVDEVMALYGPEGYRELEAEALEAVARRDGPLVLAVAGGIVADPATYDRLRALFHTIWLKASPEEHMARVRAQGDTRPMAGNPQAMAQLRSILATREALYDKAGASIDTSGQDPESSLDDLLALVAARGLLG